MHHSRQGFPWSRAKLVADGVRDRNQCRLHNLIIRNAKEIGGLLLMGEVKRRPTGAKTTRASGEHEAPRGR
jgi:hypothetical protein